MRIWILALLAISTFSARAADKFTIHTEQSTRTVKSGQAGALHLHIKPADGFKINAEAPLKVTLSSEHLKLQKTNLSHADAVEPQSVAPQFKIPFTAGRAGSTEVAADLSFFVCDPKICERANAQVKIAVQVTP